MNVLRIEYIECVERLQDILKSIEKTFNFDYNILNKEVGTIDEAYPFPANIAY